MARKCFQVRDFVDLGYGVQKGAVEQFVGARSFGLFYLKRLLQERFCLGGSLFWDCGTTPGTTDLEDGLELRAIWEGVSSSHHLNNKAAKRPNISLTSVGSLFNHFRRHPEDRSL